MQKLCIVVDLAQILHIHMNFSMINFILNAL